MTRIDTIVEWKAGENFEVKIYIVTSGSYSNYGINAVFDRRELAEAMVASCDGYEIEEYTLNPGEEHYREGRQLFKVRLRRNGDLVRSIELGWAWDDDQAKDIVTIEYVDRQMQAAVIVFESEVWAKNIEHAVKVANERRAQWIADGRWAQSEAEIRKTWGVSTLTP